MRVGHYKILAAQRLVRVVHRCQALFSIVLMLWFMPSLAGPVLEAESNNKLETANTIAIDDGTTERVGQLSSSGDADYFVFTSTGGFVKFQIWPDDPTITDGTILQATLLDAGGTTVLASKTLPNNDTISKAKPVSLIAFTRSGSVYYLKISGSMQKYYRIGATYNVLSPDNNREIEPNDKKESANKIVDVNAVKGQLSADADVDYFVFRTSGGHIKVTVKSDTAATGSALAVNLLSQDGTLIAGDILSLSGNPIDLQVTSVADANYYVEIKPSGTRLDDYSIEIVPDTSVTLKEVPPSITSVNFTPIALVAGGSVTASATTTDAVNVATFTSKSTEICTVSSSTVTGIAVGTCKIAANYSTAPEFLQSIAVAQGAQSITNFVVPTTLNVGGTGVAGATGGASNNPVTFSTLSPSVCTISGTTISAQSGGTCVIAANQAGNANFFAATEARQSITVTANGNVNSPNCTLTATPSSVSFGGSSTLTAICVPAESLYRWTGGACASNRTSTCVVTPTTTTAYSVTGSNTGGAAAVAYVTVAPLGTPVCTLTASPAVIAAGSTATLTASCTPAATSYTWLNNAFPPSVNGGTVTLSAPTQYVVIGNNSVGSGVPASAEVYVCNTPPSQGYPGLTLSGGGAAEQFASSIFPDSIDGAAGVDTIIYNCNRSSFTINKTASGWTVSSAAEGLDKLTNVERIKFGNQTLALDISGNAGQAYRLYQAAFNRVPENGGLKYWIAQMDAGMGHLEVAARFVDSDEFRTLYGINSTNAEFLTRLYSNVFHRTPDADGYAWWLAELDSGRHTKVTALAGFSESPENQAGVLNAIINGIDLLN
jgi:hypothetical protein